MKTLPSPERTYWSSVMVANSQVFFGITVATVFIGELDPRKILVVLSNLILSMLCWLSGWLFIRYE